MRWAGSGPGSRGKMGQHVHGDDDTPAAVTMAEADPPDAPTEAVEGGASPSAAAESAAPAEEAPRRGPAVPLKLLVLVAALNLGLALALFAVRPPWRVERAAAPTALPEQVTALLAQVERGERGAP